MATRARQICVLGNVFFGSVPLYTPICVQMPKFVRAPISGESATTATNTAPSKYVFEIPMFSPRPSLMIMWSRANAIAQFVLTVWQGICVCDAGRQSAATEIEEIHPILQWRSMVQAILPPTHVDADAWWFCLFCVTVSHSPRGSVIVLCWVSRY